MGQSNLKTKKEKNHKWCLAIVLNRACDNYSRNPQLFSESILRYEKNNRRDWFDEDTRKLIHSVNEPLNNTKNSDSDTLLNKKLHNLRNFYSHFHHKDYVLDFKNDDPIRVIMEAAYKKAREHVFGKQLVNSEIKEKELFDENNMITPDGVLFLSSFFVERRILRRLMGSIGGYKETEGKYSLTHDIFTTYCLKDSYSIDALDSKAVLFRDIMGYLIHVPSEYYETYLSNLSTNVPGDKDKKDQKYGQRKKSKFVIFALKFLDEFVNRTLEGFTVDIGLSKIERIEKENKQDEDENHKPRTSTKVNVWFSDRDITDQQYYRYGNADGQKYKIKIDQENQEKLDYYLHRDTTILRIKKQGGNTYYCKIGPDDLRYLVLLCLQDRAKVAYHAIYNYLNAMQEPEKVLAQGESGNFFKGLPEFILKKAGMYPDDRQVQLEKRLKYITDKWNKKKNESKDSTLNSKARDILRYINWHINRELSTPEYNRLFSMLIEKDFDTFKKRIQRLKVTERISEQTCNMLCGFDTINNLHAKVCISVLNELDELKKTDTEKLLGHTGIIRQPAPQNSQPPDYEQKIKVFAKQPTVYKGFLRNTFFIDKNVPKGRKQKSFAKLVEAELSEKYPTSDVPLGKDFYHIPSIDRFDEANSALYETLALDRICLMMARICFENINPNLLAGGEQLRWEKEGDREFIYLDITYDPSLPEKTKDQHNNKAFGEHLNIPAVKQEPIKFTIRFDRNHYTKLYVMDNSCFLGGLVQFFFKDKTKEPVDYHNLYSDGINSFTRLQREGIQAIFELEERIIKEKNLSKESNYIPFSVIMAKSGYSKDEQNAMTNVRNGLQHYYIGIKPKENGKGYYEFAPEDFKKFVDVMAREGLRKKDYWSLKV